MRKSTRSKRGFLLQMREKFVKTDYANLPIINFIFYRIFRRDFANAARPVPLAILVKLLKHSFRRKVYP